MAFSIQVENLCKRYVRGNMQSPSNNFRESITKLATRLFEPRAAYPKSEFWALDDVSIEINEGELVGVMGRNGAGKSTLLKVLSRITPPTSGVIRYRGRLASLLEVGTGFHSQLTGRENVFLNGAILGLRREEIRSKLEQIVDFSGIGAFLDTPVKFYSSGMYMRLAFAVAAHLETDILLVDEVLAVGDVEFQRRCTRRMSEVTQTGRTVLLVSHNMTLMQHHCRRGIVLEEGRVAYDGPIRDAVHRYLASTTQIGGVLAIPAAHPRRGGGLLRLTSIEVQHSESGLAQLVCGQPGKIVLTLEADPARLPIASASISLILYTTDGVRLVNLWSRAAHGDLRVEAASVRCEVLVPRVPLRAGEYRLEVFIEALGEASDWIENVGTLTIGQGDYFGTGIETDPDQGVMFWDHSWRLEEGGTRATQ